MECVIIGCGLTGAVIARQLAENGEKVIIFERRSHIGGNMFDYFDEHGILVHKYGPHIFHTNNEKVWKYVNRFEEWKPFKLVCGASWDGKYTPTAFNFRTIDVFYPKKEAERLKRKLLEAYPDKESATVVELLNHSDQEIRGYAEYLFKNDYAPYTAKQWGVSPEEIDPIVLKRVPIRFSYDESYFSDKYEAMPVHSYTAMFNTLLDHQNITIRLGVEALDHLSIEGNMILFDGKFEKDLLVVYTGALDELFKYRFGKLPYRSLRFEWRHDDIESLQEAPVVAYPQKEGYTRITEYRKLPIQQVKGTTYAIEYPLPYVEGKKMEPYYPVLTETSKQQYIQYQELAKKIQNLYIGGRLGDFKYYNMDQALERALDLAQKIISISL